MKKISKKMTVFIIILSVLFALCAGVIVSGIYCNKALELNTYTIKTNRLPKSFEGFRIAHVSDLHNAEFGKDNEDLLQMLSEASPDIIAITGDIIDSRRTDVEIAVKFVEKAAEIAPCYYVTGNHESRVPEEFEELLTGLTEAGVTVLRDEALEIERDSETITLLGVDDPDFEAKSIMDNDSVIMDKKLKEIKPAEDSTFTLLLSHRPELFEIYCENSIDLVLSGHAHGGQFRLPIIGGLYAPDQGLLPEYDSGLYQQDSTSLIVSRGIGNSLFPLRLFNKPEIILIELTD